LTIGWLGCVQELKQIADAFEELKTEGLKVTRTIDEVVNWLTADRKLISQLASDDASKRNKFQWRVVACLISERFEAGAASVQN